MKKTLLSSILILYAAMTAAQVTVTGDIAGFANTRQSRYKGSIFTKSLATEDFANTNNISVGYGMDSNYQNLPYSHWQRVADTTRATLAQAANTFPVLFSATIGFSSLFGFNSMTPTNGLMVMSMQDQIPDWGGTGASGDFDSWIEFPAIHTHAPSIEVSFYQYYQNFNSDSCFIEYHTNLVSDWNPVNINVHGVDVHSNNFLLGWKTVTIPVPSAGADSMYIRIRWKSDSDDGGAYGYFWMIDDVEICETPNHRISVSENEFMDGNYQLVPRGMHLPEIAWYVDVRNTGSVMQSGTGGEIRTVAAQPNVLGATQPVNLVPNQPVDERLYIDPNRLITMPPTPNGTSTWLPSANNGTFKVYSTVFSDSLNDANGKSIMLDTIAYTVNENTADSSYVWGRDNGILAGCSEGWTYGLDRDLYPTNEADVNEVGFTQRTLYRTGSTVPANWVIRGIEIVAAPGKNGESYAKAGAKIDALLSWDSTNGNNIYFNEILTGATTYTIQNSDLNQFDIGYRTLGNYNTIRINFPMQPALNPNTIYRIGYTKANDTAFAPAVFQETYLDTNGTYRRLPNNMDKEFGMEQYGNIIYQPSVQSLTCCGKAATPYIRMIVGPRINIPNFNLTFSVNPANSAAIYSDDATSSDVTGQTISVARGTAYPIIIVPDFENDWDLVDIRVNGQSVDFNNDVVAQSDYYTYTVPAISGNTTVEVICNGSGTGSINAADNATIKLQPNPASTSARLTINGVNGDVNFALIDMNGRVINEKVINANSVETIDLNGLARGTYFVRITNNHMTKVEKLIVR